MSLKSDMAMLDMIVERHPDLKDEIDQEFRPAIIAKWAGREDGRGKKRPNNEGTE